MTRSMSFALTLEERSIHHAGGGSQRWLLPPGGAAQIAAKLLRQGLVGPLGRRGMSGPWVALHPRSANLGAATLLGWAEYIDYGDHIEISLRPTKTAWALMGPNLETWLWDSFFDCIGWDDGFSRLSEEQWNSLWLQHRCHLSLGVVGRIESGDTFDYESWHPFRGDLLVALDNGCNWCRVRQPSPCC